MSAWRCQSPLILNSASNDYLKHKNSQISTYGVLKLLFIKSGDLNYKLLQCNTRKRIGYSIKSITATKIWQQCFIIDPTTFYRQVLYRCVPGLIETSTCQNIALQTANKKYAAHVHRDSFIVRKKVDVTRAVYLCMYFHYQILCISISTMWEIKHQLF